MNPDTSILTAYEHAPVNRELETVIRFINSQGVGATNIATERHRADEDYLHTSDEVKPFFKTKKSRDSFSTMSDAYIAIGRGGNIPAINHLFYVAWGLQTLQFPESSVILSHIHDHGEDTVGETLTEGPKDKAHLQKIIQLNKHYHENPLVKMGYDPQTAMSGNVLSDDHMFVVKQLRNFYLEKNKKMRNIQSRHIRRQFDEMLDVIDHPRLIKIVNQDKNKFLEYIASGSTGTQALKMINRNSIIYPLYTQSILDYADETFKRKDIGDEEKLNIVLDLAAVKTKDCIHNSIDDEFMNHQRRTRRIVKEYEIIMMVEKLLPKVVEHPDYEKLEYLHYTLLEIHHNKLNNYATHINIQRPTENDKSYRDRIRKEQRQRIEKYREQGLIGAGLEERDVPLIGYRDPKMMKRHEAKILEIKGLRPKDLEYKLQDFKNPDDETLHNVLAQSQFYRGDVK